MTTDQLNETRTAGGADATSPPTPDPPAPDPRHPDADALVEQVKPAERPPGDWPELGSVPVSVLIPAKNEELNIVECIRHLAWADQVVVVDSQSTDATIPMTQAMGAEVYQFHLSEEGWPKKKNWSIENVPWRNEWLLIMDADEIMTPELCAEIVDVVHDRYARKNGCGDGYWLNRRFIFMNRWLKHCGYYPSWNVRLFKHKLGRYERIGGLSTGQSGDHEIHEHVVLDSGEPGYLKHDFLHYAYPDLTTLIAKHNAYATWEAHAMLEGYSGQIRPSLFGGPIARRRWLRHRTRRMPFRPLMRFVFSYIFQLGFLDGLPGYYMCKLLAWYEFISVAKSREMRLPRSRYTPPSEPTAGVKPPPAIKPTRSDAASSDNGPDADRDKVEDNSAFGPDGAPVPELKDLGADAIASRSVSPWSFRQKVGRMVWYMVQGTVFRWSPRTAYGWRNWLLRRCGAKVHPTVRIRPTVDIEVPWHLSLGAYTVVGDRAILYCLGRVTIGDRVLISQYAHICAGTHDPTRIDMPLVCLPIDIGDDAWVAADAFVGPGVRVGEGVLLGARSTAVKHLEPWKIYVGNPAKAIRDREFRRR